MTPKFLSHSLMLLSSLALPMAAHAVTPTIVQSSMSSGPSAPITLTLRATPTPGNMLFAVVGFGIYGDRNFNPPDSTWNCNLGGGGSVRINTCSHLVVSGDATSYTFTPTSGGPSVQGVVFEAAGTVNAQVAYSYTGASLGNLATTSSPSLTPSVVGMLPIGITAGGDPSSPGQLGWSTMQAASLLGVFSSNTLTTDTATPVSTQFNYNYHNEHNSVQAMLLLAPGTFAATPAVNVQSGSYNALQPIVLSVGLPGAIIHYTLDGSVPTCSSPIYSGPLSILTTSTLSYLACAPGYAASTVQTVTYVVGSGTLAGISLGPMGDLHGYVPFAGDAFHQPVNAVPVDPNSANIIAGIGSNHLHHDWSSVRGGNYGIPYTVVDSSVTPVVPFTNQESSDESDLTLYPIPANLTIESAPPTCTITGDNHAIILDKATGVDYELYRAQYCPGTTPVWQAANGVLWDMTTVQKRPYTYTSVDAAGLSVFEGLVRYDEILAGAINHALRFTTTQTRCDHYRFGDPVGAFVAPATHAACNNSGTLNVMGMRIRLRADFDISGYSATNKIILTAMKKYGMILADNGSSLFFQGTPDARWDDDDLGALDRIGSSSFEIVQMPQVYTNDSHPTGPAPVINNFTASSTTITTGQSVTLNASVAGASYSYIDNAGFMRTSSMIVSPTQTTTYTLTSRNAFGTTSASTTVTVVPAPYLDPVLALAGVAGKTVTDSPFILSAHSLSSGQISFSVVSGPASVSGNVVTLQGVGMVVIEARQISSGSYIATTATTSFAVAGIAPGLAVNAIADQVYGALPLTAAAQSNSSAPVVFSVLSGPATVSGRTVTVNGVGTITLQASQVASGRYASATAQVSFTVKPATPQLAFATISNMAYGVGPITLASTSNSSGGNVYSVVSGPAVVEGNTLTVTGVGRIYVMVSQAAAGNYTAATATSTFKIVPAVPQLAFASIPTQTYGGAPVAVSASSASSGAITYYVAGGPATMVGNILTLNGAGTVTLLASQAATANYTATVVSTSFTVRTQRPAISLQLNADAMRYLSPIAFKFRLTTIGNTSPTGLIQLLDNGIPVAVYPMLPTDAGVVRGVLPITLRVGQHSLTANYLGDRNFDASISPAVSLTVTPPPTSSVR